MPAHVVLALRLFDPNRHVDHTYYFEVDDTVDLELAVSQMQQRLPARAT